MKSLIVPALCGLSLLSVPARADATKNCHIGSYRLSDGQALDIAPSDGDALRWRAFTGETGRLDQNKDGSWTSTFGWTDKPDGKTVSFSDCTKGEITFGKETGKRIAFDVSERIQSLIAAGKDYTLAVYPGVEHGMTEYELKPDGTRVSTRFAPGYFAMMRDFIRDGHIGDHYGKAEITRLPVH